MNHLGTRGSVDVHHGRRGGPHGLGGVQADGHVAGRVGDARAVVPVAVGRVLHHGGRRKGHELRAIQALIEPVVDRGVGGVEEDRAVPEGPRPVLHAAGDPGHDLLLDEQLRHPGVDVIAALVGDPRALEQDTDGLLGDLGAQVGMGKRVRAGAVSLGEPGQARACRDALVGHGRMDPQAVDLGALPQQLVDPHVGEDTARQHDVAVAGLPQRPEHVGHQQILEPLLRGGADVLAGEAREVAEQAALFVLGPVPGQLEVGVVVPQAEELLHDGVGPRGVTPCGQAGDLAGVEDAEAEILGDLTVELTR